MNYSWIDLLPKNGTLYVALHSCTVRVHQTYQLNLLGPMSGFTLPDISGLLCLYLRHKQMKCIGKYIKSA